MKKSNTSVKRIKSFSPNDKDSVALKIRIPGGRLSISVDANAENLFAYTLSVKMIAQQIATQSNDASSCAPTRLLLHFPRIGGRAFR